MDDLRFPSLFGEISASKALKVGALAVPIATALLWLSAATRVVGGSVDQMTLVVDLLLQTELMASLLSTSLPVLAVFTALLLLVLATETTSRLADTLFQEYCAKGSTTWLTNVLVRGFGALYVMSAVAILLLWKSYPDTSPHLGLLGAFLAPFIVAAFAAARRYRGLSIAERARLRQTAPVTDGEADVRAHWTFALFFGGVIAASVVAGAVTGYRHGQWAIGSILLVVSAATVPAILRRRPRWELFLPYAVVLPAMLVALPLWSGSERLVPWPYETLGLENASCLARVLDSDDGRLLVAVRGNGDNLARVSRDVILDRRIGGDRSTTPYCRRSDLLREAG